jgi:hypothetical protein
LVRLVGCLELHLKGIGVRPLGLQLGLKGYDIVVQLGLAGLERGLEVVLLGGQLGGETLNLVCEV